MRQRPNSFLNSTEKLLRETDEIIMRIRREARDKANETPEKKAQKEAIDERT